VPDLATSAKRLRQQLDESLVYGVHDACERALAFARLERALEAAVDGLAHPAVTLERRARDAGPTVTIRLLGRNLIRWCFGAKRVDVYYRSGLSRVHLRLTFAAHAREWRINAPGSATFLGSFDDEEEKVLEVLEDAFREIVPWVGVASV
jgi:hypothetical protein